MAISTITSGQKDWLSTLNNDLTELNNRDSGTWTDSGLTAMNGYVNNGCHYFLGKIGGQEILAIQGNLSTSDGTIGSQTAREVLQLPSNIVGYGRGIASYSYGQNNNQVPLRVSYEPKTKRLSFVNVSGTAATFTSIDFTIILTN